jgi:hypothetical protein
MNKAETNKQKFNHIDRRKIMQDQVLRIIEKAKLAGKYLTVSSVVFISACSVHMPGENSPGKGWWSSLTASENHQPSQEERFVPVVTHKAPEPTFSVNKPEANLPGKGWWPRQTASENHQPSQEERFVPVVTHKAPEPNFNVNKPETNLPRKGWWSSQTVSENRQPSLEERYAPEVINKAPEFTFSVIKPEANLPRKGWWPSQTVSENRQPSLEERYAPEVINKAPEPTLEELCTMQISQHQNPTVQQGIVDHCYQAAGDNDSIRIKSLYSRAVLAFLNMKDKEDVKKFQELVGEFKDSDVLIVDGVDQVAKLKAVANLDDSYDGFSNAAAELVNFANTQAY